MDAAIRPFTPEDYEAITHVNNTVYFEYPKTAGEWRFNDDHRGPECRMQRWVAEVDGGIVGYAEYHQVAWQYHPRKFSVLVALLPEHQGRGAGARLYNAVTGALAPFDPLSLRSQAREDMRRGVRFLEDRGYREDMRSWESRLDVAGFDPAPFADAGRRAEAEGIRIRTLKELEGDPDRDRKLYDLNWVLEQDVPHTDPLTQPSFDHFMQTHLGGPNLLPDAYFVALDGNEYVGVSQLWSTQGNADLYTGLTATRREYRRRGIALAMKLRAIAYAKREGRTVIKTWNEIRNRGMLSINEALGFVKQPAWIEYVKLAPEAGETGAASPALAGAALSAQG